MDDGRLRHFTTTDGLSLAVRQFGDYSDHGLPVICLPGLSRNSRDFIALSRFLSSPQGGGRAVYAFDYRGRGQSDHDKDWTRYDIGVEASDVLAGMAALGLFHALFIGTSRGGLIMHVLAGMRPGVMKAGVLNDIGPELGGEGLAHIKYYLQQAPQPEKRADVLPLTKRIHGDAFPALDDAELERFGLAALQVKDDGTVAADYDPKLLKTVEALDFSQPQATMWPQFAGLATMPLLVIRGENSRLLERATVERMTKMAPSMTVVEAPGQGHPPMLEKGDLPNRIAAFFETVDPQR